MTTLGRTLQKGLRKSSLTRVEKLSRMRRIHQLSPFQITICFDRSNIIYALQTLEDVRKSIDDFIDSKPPTVFIALGSISRPIDGLSLIENDGDYFIGQSFCIFINEK